MESKKIILNSQFYDKKEIENALLDFNEICEGIIDEGYIITLKIKKEISFNIKDEFSNYVLGLMNQN